MRATLELFWKFTGLSAISFAIQLLKAGPLSSEVKATDFAH